MTKIKTMSEQDEAVVAEWADGETRAYMLEDLPQSIINALAVSRLKAKLEDAHASLGSQGVAACREATDAVWERLVAGEWSRGRSGNPWLIEALVDSFPDQINAAKARKIYDDEKTRKTAYKLPEVIRWKAERDLARTGDAETDVTSIF